LLLQQRLQRQQQLGIVRQDATMQPLPGLRAWSSLTDAERANSARRMEIYAAMVEELDRHVGRVVDQLRSSGQLDNTVIVFLSDNGAENLLMNVPFSADGSRAFGPMPADVVASLGVDNGTDNLGNANSYVSYGPAWGHAATAPRSRLKGTTAEGGINTVAFITGRGVDGGRVEAQFTHVKDIAATLLDLAGVPHPRQFGGRDVAPLEGHSWRAMLRDANARIWPETEPVGWELHQWRALRKGSWKIVFNPAAEPASGGGRWSLYDLGSDPGESRDLSNAQPQRLAELVADWNQYAQRTGVFVPPQSSASATH
jgi:arylsulfatase